MLDQTNRNATYATARSNSGGAIFHIAAVTGVFIAGLGAGQLFAPALVSPLTGIEASTGGDIIGLQWGILGGLLAVGGIIRTRVLVIFAAEFVLISALAALAIKFYEPHDSVSMLVLGAVALVGLVNSGITRLADKAELKREMRLMREQASLPRDQGHASTVEGEST